MKKTLRYTIFFWTVFVISSCVQPFDVTDRAKFSGKYGMNISVICTTPETKADGVVVGPTDKPGEDVYNENTVDYVDYYIFKSDSDTGAALIHDRATKVTTVSGTTNNPTYEVVRDLDMDEWVVDGQHSFYVYTIANMPELDHSQMPVTLADLKNLGLVTAFNNDPFDEQNNFVMRGGETVTFPEGDQGGVETVVPKLSRVAAKVTINMNIAPAIDQVTHMPNGAVRYDMTWYPDLSDIDVYLSFANKETKIAGDPISWSAEDQNKFFTYYRDAFVATVSPETSTTPDWDNVSWRWNVTGTPFYTYPMSWTADSPQAPFLKVILKWEAHKEGDPHEPPYYVPTEDGEKFVRAKRERNNQVKTATEYYYKIPIPSEVLNSNDWYNLTFDVAILGSTAEELPVILAGQYYVTDWSDPKVTTAGDLKQDRYLSTASNTYHIYGIDDIEIPVTSSHEIEATVVKREVLYNNQWRDATYRPGQNDPNQVKNMQSRSINIQYAEDGRSYFKFTDALTTAMSANLDCYQMRFTLQLKHEDGQGPTKTIVIEQDPPIYIKKVDGGNVMVDGYFGNVGNRFQSWQPGGDESPTLNAFSNNTTTYQNGRVTVTFANGFSRETNQNRMSTQGSGTITVTAPVGVTITRIDITYRGNGYAATNNTPWSPSGTTNTVNQWRGSAQEVTAQLTRNGTITVTAIRVYYTSTTGEPGDSGASGTNTGTVTDTPYAPISNYVNTQQSMTVITISSLGNNSGYTIPNSQGRITTLPGQPGPYDYLLTDPRENAGFTSADLEPYFNGTTTVPWGDNAAKVKIGSTTTPNFIAPKIMVSSRWGRMGAWNNQHYLPSTDEERFEVAQKRCATYQEAGYPAGRWRLPTEAEIMFIASLQEYDFIDDLFTATGYSISAFGSVFTVGTTVGYNTNRGSSCRCVYDLWYWGDDPVVDASTYAVMP